MPGTSTLIYKKYNISYKGSARVTSHLVSKEQFIAGPSPVYKWTYDFIIRLKISLNKTFGKASDLIYISDDVGNLKEYKDRTCELNADNSSVTVTMTYKSAFYNTGTTENPPNLKNVQVNYKGVIAIRDVQIKIIN